jgi:branched-chain amino acid aminotransferase
MCAVTVLHARIDGNSRPLEAATISVADDGLLRGDGVYEVLRVYAGSPFAVDEHLDRMSRSAAGLRLPLDVDAARHDILQLAAVAGNTDALIRLVKTRGGRRIALLESVPVFPASVSLATLPYCPTGLLDGLKTISYAANSLATRLANERAADQALLVTPQGWVLEGPNFAAFFVFADRDTLVTPPLDEGILDSITRRHLMALVPAEEHRIHVDEFVSLREMFVSSTIREVLPVSAIDGMTLPACPGPRTSDTQRAFAAQIEVETATTPAPSAT